MNKRWLLIRMRGGAFVARFDSPAARLAVRCRLPVTWYRTFHDAYRSLYSR